MAVLVVWCAMNDDLRVDWNRLPLKYIALALLAAPITTFHVPVRQHPTSLVENADVHGLYMESIPQE